MAEEKNLYLFEQASVPRAVASMAVPTIISSLVMVIYNLADTYFVGMLNDPVQNAAVTLSAPVLLAFNAVNNLFGVGTSSMMSRALGRKEYDTVRRASAFGFYCTVFCSILFSLIYMTAKGPLLVLLGTDADTLTATGEYMKWTVACGAVPAILNVVMAYMVRSEGGTMHASIGTMSGCILNILLDPVFILPQGLDMGASGAGAATFISNCAACLYFFVLLFIKRGKTYVCINPRMFRFSRAVAKEICGVGIPALIQNLLNVTGMTVLNNFTSGYGSAAVAAMGISQKIDMVPMNIVFGFSQGVMPLISYNYASGNRKRMKETVVFSAKLTVSSLVVIAACFFLGAGFWMRLFIRNEEIIAYGTHFLRGLCLALPFFNLDVLAIGVFQAVGMGRKSFFFAILRKIIMEIPAIYLLNKFVPLYGMAYAQLVTEVILAVAAVVVLRRMLGEEKCGLDTDGRSAK
jgi:putative MATE family efflux protein